MAEELCLACGLCCNGVLFKDVELQPGDDAARLKSVGLPVRNPSSPQRPPKFAQPCVALGADCRCRIYAERPARCRDFECALFKAVVEGRTDTAAALRLVRAARRRVARVGRLLGELGDTDEHVPLSVRFRRVMKRFETHAPDAEAAAVFSKLTVAMQRLNVVLSEKFYPGSSA